MFAIRFKFTRLLLLAALGLIACLILEAATSGGPWPDGESYSFMYSSGGLFGFSQTPYGYTKTFGGAPFTSGLFGYADQFWDATDTAGLLPNQVKLIFYLTREGSSGSLPGEMLTVFGGLQPPPGATYLEDSARITFTFSSGAPLAIGPTFDGSGIFGTFTSGSTQGYYFDGSNAWQDSGIFGSSGTLVTGMTYEIVVDNVPEPVTLGLFASGALLLAGRLVARNRRKA